MATKSTTAAVAAPSSSVVIKPARLRTVEFKIVGESPLVQARFSGKAMQAMMSKMAAGPQANKSRAKDARDFNADFENAKHIGTDGKQGIPAGAFRQAMISACRLVGFKMTLAKLSVFVEADTFDRVDGIPLVHFNGTPERMDAAVRNATGVADIRVRPMWRTWDAKVRIRFDEDQFSSTDVTNLLVRVGQQVGIGEGRPDSRESAGLGWGTFRVE
jgi:hypothetical protein